MAWADNLLEASFRGVVFDCISTDDKISRANSTHSYPYADGAEIEDLGAEPIPVAINAIFFGNDYDARLQAFIAVLNQPGLGDLIHPVFGTISVQFIDATFHHEADNVDQVSITLNFLQNSIAPKFFDKTLAIQKATAVLQANSNAREAATKVLSDEVAAVAATNNFNRIEQLRTSMTSVISQVKTQIASLVTSGLDPINFVSGWAADLTSLITGIVDLRSFDVDTLTADWKAVFNAMDVAILLPVQARQPVRDAQIIAAHSALEQANGRADAASIVLASETQVPSLSAIEIEAMVNATRTPIEAVIVQYRAIYGIEKSRPVVEALKTTALALQEAARAVIEARPPLITKTMDAPGNLRLIAHKLYADHTRAVELFRLNPKIKMPNYIERGDVLNAYAS